MCTKDKLHTKLTEIKQMIDLDQNFSRLKKMKDPEYLFYKETKEYKEAVLKEFFFTIRLHYTFDSRQRCIA